MFPTLGISLCDQCFLLSVLNVIQAIGVKKKKYLFAERLLPFYFWEILLPSVTCDKQRLAGEIFLGVFFASIVGLVLTHSRG